MIRLAVAFAVVGGVAMASAQVAGPAFDVTSVKPNVSGETRSMVSWPRGSFSAVNAQLRMLIAMGYGIRAEVSRFTLVGGPDDLLNARFDIQARTPDGAPEGQHVAMLRTLLSDRFKLRAHYESRPTPIYSLMLAREDRRFGADLRPSTVDCDAERERARQRGDRLTAENTPRDAKGRPLCWGTSQFSVPGAWTLTSAGPLAALVQSIQGMVDRPVIDATGLTGKHEWQLVFAFGAKPNPDLPTIYTAVQEQLGLKLEGATAPLEVLVIEAVSRPTSD